MLLINKNIISLLPILRLDFYGKETCFLIQTRIVNEVITILKSHYKYQFKILTCISGVDYPENLYRFQIVYELLSIKYNFRIRVKVLIDELTPIDSVENIFSGAPWWECEIWDMFGIFFIQQHHLVRLLTDYGFEGYPLRKDFPLSGFNESKYNVIKKRVVYEDLELSQEYRVFDFRTVWD